jgi:type II secretory pathway pseudopilin PulG
MALIVAVIAETSEMEMASTTEMEVASTMRAPPSVDYDAAARLALIVVAKAGVARAKARAEEERARLRAEEEAERNYNRASFRDFGAAVDYDDDDDKGGAGFELNDDRRAVGGWGGPETRTSDDARGDDEKEKEEDDPDDGGANGGPIHRSNIDFDTIRDVFSRTEAEMKLQEEEEKALEEYCCDDADEEDVVINNNNASKKCKEAGGAQDSIDNDDDDDNSSSSSSSSSSLDDDDDDDDSDDDRWEYQRMVREYIARNKARLAKEMESKGEVKDLKASAQPDEVGKQSGHLIADLGDNHKVHCTIQNDEVDLLALVDELYLAECECDDLGSITINDVHRAVVQRLGLGNEPLDKKRKKLIKGRLMDLITGEA